MTNFVLLYTGGTMPEDEAMNAEVMAAITQIRLDTLDDVLHADAEGRVAAMNMIARRFQQ